MWITCRGHGQGGRGRGQGDRGVVREVAYM